MRFEILNPKSDFCTIVQSRFETIKMIGEFPSVEYAQIVFYHLKQGQVSFTKEFGVDEFAKPKTEDFSRCQNLKSLQGVQCTYDG